MDDPVKCFRCEKSLMGKPFGEYHYVYPAWGSSYEYYCTACYWWVRRGGEKGESVVSRFDILDL